jgi:hypothetical protein
VDLVEAFYDETMKKEVPERDMNAAVSALPFIREKLNTYAAYGTAGVKEIYGNELTEALEVNTLASTVFFNRGDHFEARALPTEAQFSPAIAVCIGDYNGDGNEDVFLSQNYFAMAPETSRNDAGRGLWLKGDARGELTPAAGHESGVKVYGDQRGAALCDYDGDGRVDLVVAQNGAETKLYHNVGGKPGLRVLLKGSPDNPRGVGATVRVKFAERWGAAREVHAGSGYWSQDSAVMVLGTPEPPSQIQVLWPGGKIISYDLSSGAREVHLSPGGEIDVLR